MPPSVNMSHFDWKFYINHYQDIHKKGIKTEKQAKIHYKQYGAKEGRLKNKQEIISDFDWKFYLSYYPDIKKNGIKNETHALNHYKYSGVYEGRIKNAKEININLLNSNKKIDAYNFMQFKKTTENYINICIRTSNRPEYFNLCINSILQQNYKNYNIIVCYDKKQSIAYLNKYTHMDNITIFVPTVSSTKKYKFNLYCNDMMEKVKKGWIMFLDDDDQLTSKNSLKIINEHMNNNNDLLIWKFLRPDRLIYPQNPNNIKLGEIDTTCFLFHSTWKNIAQWEDKQCGDYNFIKKYIEKSTTKPHFVMMQHILTKTSDEYEGCHFGSTNNIISTNENINKEVDKQIIIKQETFFLDYVVNHNYIFHSYNKRKEILNSILKYLH
jgi:hypothetical protein